eukprot:scaffold156227_cov17-Tisochrysis_lutea.AAC.2
MSTGRAGSRRSSYRPQTMLDKNQRTKEKCTRNMTWSWPPLRPRLAYPFPPVNLLRTSIQTLEQRLLIARDSIACRQPGFGVLYPPAVALAQGPWGSMGPTAAHCKCAHAGQGQQLQWARAACIHVQEQQHSTCRHPPGGFTI